MTEGPLPPADRWAKRNLTPEQTALAGELARRADRLWTDADGELSLAEAMAVAAMQLGHFPDGATT